MDSTLERPLQIRCTRNEVLAATVAAPWTAFRANVSILEELKVKERLSSTVHIRILKFFGHITWNKLSMERLFVQGKVNRANGHAVDHPRVGQT
ncbi:jg26895 [Pararge aegeria aegeria]|uniref:Jg26895 protein n=1 Tax=Pararge aegeria aegeria TaxID=348720 RepID=A0A8S4SE28_9NEOP|nr:jg26895 [Pararge aegeria aegeria]